jgi:hypothetical protein
VIAVKKLTDARVRGNILYVDFLDDETNEKNEEIIIIKNDYGIIDYEELYEYSSERDVQNGNLAVFVIASDEVDTWFKVRLALHKDTIRFYVGEEYDKFMKRIKPFKAKKKKVDGNLKIIDFYISGDQMKLYLGKPDCEDYWGDDWNDRPYEHNAGRVYDEFVEDTVIVNFLGENEYLTEACEGMTNSPYSKEDFINGTPFAYLSDGYLDFRPYRRTTSDLTDVIKFYFNTPIKELYKKKYLITD